MSLQLRQLDKRSSLRQHCAWVRDLMWFRFNQEYDKYTLKNYFLYLNFFFICVGWASVAAWAFLWWGERGRLCVAVSGLLTAVVSLAAERRLQALGRRYSSRGLRAAGARASAVATRGLVGGGSQAPRRAGFSSCSRRAQSLRHMGLSAPWHVEFFQARDQKPCPLH